mmetsp:Transcript_25824/g.77795  ORF Transcript_25824/g.77795 Transcript_25824/m.77795 type:complete len:105 (-) Transcript_25824:14-328(-)
MLALLMSDRKWRVRAGGPKGEFVRLVRFPMMRADGLFDEARGPNGQEVPVGSRKLETCSGCNATGWTKLQACARCRVARYCSRACQVKHWPEHKAERAAASNGA